MQESVCCWYSDNKDGHDSQVTFLYNARNDLPKAGETQALGRIISEFGFEYPKLELHIPTRVCKLQQVQNFVS